MKKKGILIAAFLLVLSGVFYINAQYPFVTSKVGKWSVGFGFSKDPLKNLPINSKNVISYEAVDRMLNTEENYIADPFFVKEKDTFYLFVELKGEKNADIALFKSSDGLDYTYEGVILNEPFHLSYPQVFKYKEEFYMLPETKQAGHVLLYKAEKFPEKWKIEDTLIKNVSLKDPSILLNTDFNLIIAVDDHMNQFLYESDSLRGEWKKSEKFIGRKGNETRPGGRFFKYEDNWFLPVQDRTHGYGSGITLYKLEKNNHQFKLKLSEKGFLKGMKDIKWFNRGMHHVDIQQIDNSFYMVYDGDRNMNGENAFQIRRSLKYSFYDLFNR